MSHRQGGDAAIGNGGPSGRGRADGAAGFEGAVGEDGGGDTGDDVAADVAG